MSDVGYDEFGMLADNTQEVGLQWSGRPSHTASGSNCPTASA